MEGKFPQKCKVNCIASSISRSYNDLHLPAPPCFRARSRPRRPSGRRSPARGCCVRAPALGGAARPRRSRCARVKTAPFTRRAAAAGRRARAAVPRASGALPARARAPLGARAIDMMAGCVHGVLNADSSASPGDASITALTGSCPRLTSIRDGPYRSGAAPRVRPAAAHVHPGPERARRSARADGIEAIWREIAERGDGPAFDEKMRRIRAMGAPLTAPTARAK